MNEKLFSGSRKQQLNILKKQEKKRLLSSIERINSKLHNTFL